MQMSGIPFGVTDWLAIEMQTFAGDAGMATWRTRQFADLRVRMVEYTPGYVADHWCQKGHILLCVEGELQTTVRHTLDPAQMDDAGRAALRAVLDHAERQGLIAGPEPVDAEYEELPADSED